MTSLTPRPNREHPMSTSSADPFALQESIKTLIKCSIRLDLDSQTVCNACQYMHRFGLDFNVEQYDTDLIAATALYLSAKVTENHIKLKDTIFAFYEEIHKKALSAEEDVKLYTKLRESVIDCELLLIRMLKFKVDAHLPHRYLNIYLETLFRWMGDPTTAGQLNQACWPLLNDYLCLDRRSLYHKPNQIAIAVIELALRCLEYQIPYNDEAIVYTWNEVFDENLTKEQIQEMCDQIASLYEDKSRPTDHKYAPQKVIDYRSHHR